VSQEQRDALEQLLRDAPLDLGGDLAEQRVIFGEMMAAIPVPADVTTSSGASAGSVSSTSRPRAPTTQESSSTCTAVRTRSRRPRRPSVSRRTSRVALEPGW
jgi:hypothetical protein